MEIIINADARKASQSAARVVARLVRDKANAVLGQILEELKQKSEEDNR